MTMTTNDNTNTNTSDHERQMVWLEIHHISSPWHDHHVTMSPLDMSSPLPSPSPHALAFTSEWFPEWFLPHHNKHHQQRPSTVCLPHLTIYLLHPVLHPHLILMVSFLPIFLIPIILSIRSTATTPPHHHYQYCQPTPNQIGSRHVCISSLRLFFFIYIVLMFIYHIDYICVQSPNTSQWAPHLNIRHLSTSTYPATKRAWLTAQDVSRALGRFFFPPFYYDTNIYLWLDHTASPRHVWPQDCCVDTSNQHQKQPLDDKKGNTSCLQKRPPWHIKWAPKWQ